MASPCSGAGLVVGLLAPTLNLSLLDGLSLCAKIEAKIDGGLCGEVGWKSLANA